jgi:hypothetical protein
LVHRVKSHTALIFEFVGRKLITAYATNCLLKNKTRSGTLMIIGGCCPKNELSMHPTIQFSDDEIMTAPSAWDPSVLDNEIDSDDDDFYDALQDTNVNLHDQVDECGNYRQVFL